MASLDGDRMAVTASQARARLFPLIEQVNADQEAVEIVSKRGTAYLVSEAQFRSLMETAYLLRSPANAQRLIESVGEVETDSYAEHQLLQ